MCPPLPPPPRLDTIRSLTLKVRSQLKSSEERAAASAEVIERIERQAASDREASSVALALASKQLGKATEETGDLRKCVDLFAACLASTDDLDGAFSWTSATIDDISTKTMELIETWRAKNLVFRAEIMAAARVRELLAAERSKKELAEDAVSCIVCMDRRRIVALQPCMHLTHCDQCDVGQTCAICNEAVQGTVKVFLP